MAAAVFDRIRFYPVTTAELAQHRADFLTGKFQVRVEEEVFKLRDYQSFLAENAESISAFRTQQRAAFGEERERWAAAGEHAADAEPMAEALADEIVLPPGGRRVSAHLPGSVWQVAVAEGDRVSAGDKLVILESMKMETAITAPVAGRIERILVAPGKVVEAGQALVVLVET